MLGESAQAAFSRQRWVQGDDPGKFLNKLDSIIAEAAYYGKAFSEDRLAQIFPTLVPNDGDWVDFQKTLLCTHRVC
jgi:hypothetical protein